MSGKNFFKISLAAFLSFFAFGLLFSPALALLGDINLDDLVDEADLFAIGQTLGKYYTDPGFDPFLDLNMDNDVDVEDLAIAGRSFGSQRNFHFPRRLNNSDNSTIYLSSCNDAAGRIHIIWSESSNVYYTRLDRFGNTLIDDLLLEHGGYAGDNGVAIGCDDQGTSHMLWDCADSNHGTCQARVDQYGYLLYAGRMDAPYPPTGWPAVDLDSSGRAHLFYTKHTAAKTFYSVLDPNGELQISQQILPRAERYHDLVVDTDDAAHLLYPVYTDTFRLAYQRIGAAEVDSLAPRALGVLGWEGGYNSSIRPSLAVDANRNVFASYFTFSTLPQVLYLEKLAPNGDTLVDSLPIFPEYDNGANGGAQTDIALDTGGNLHMLSFTDFIAGTGVAHTAYGVFNNGAASLQPMRMAIYGTPVSYASLLLDTNNDAALIYRAGTNSGYPPCSDYSLCFQGTAFEENTYNLDLPDLGTDVAHLSWDPFVLRWNAPAAISGTVFNSGWYTSTATTLRVSLVLSETDPTVLDSTDLAIPALGPYQAYAFTAPLLLPHAPDAGYEALKFLRLHLDVDPAEQIGETSETNNHINAPIPVEPIPTRTRLYLVIRDETQTVVGGADAAEYASAGTAYIEGPGFPKQEQEITGYTTILANDIPVGDALVNYSVGWQAEGYRTPTPVQIGVMRNASDPYKIDYSPLNTAVMVTDRWGSLSGTITGSDTGEGLAGAAVRLVGQGLSLEALTDFKGNFSPSTLAALGKLIPGEYQIRISRANYARLVETLKITALNETVVERVMEPTEIAYLHGNVINDFGNPVPGAALDACGTTGETDDQGIFDMEVKADCKSLQITRQFYAPASQPLSLTAGLESLLGDLTLIFDPPVLMVGAGDRVASRVIDVSTGGMLPDAPSDAGFALNQLYETFKDEFWIDYRILVLYGCYEYNVSAAYSGAPGDYRLEFVQVNLKPRTFEIHMSLGSINFLGVTIPIPIVSDSGMRSALYAIETRLVDSDTGASLATARNPIEGGGPWIAFEDTVKTYDFDGALFADPDNTEVWLYLKAGQNSSGIFESPPQLYQFNQQILKLNLGTGVIYGSYALGSFPLP